MHTLSTYAGGIPEPFRPPTVEDAELPAPRVRIASFRSPRVKALLSDDKFERLLHGRGSDVIDIYRNIGQRGFGGADAAVDLVFFPETEEDVKALLDEASERSICVVPFG